MTNTLLNIAGKIDPQTVAILETVSRAIADLDMPYVVVGATLLSGYESRMSQSSMYQ